MSDDRRDICLHHRIDNATAQCIECGEQMIAVTHDAETILSAPNLAACTNPACKTALTDGTYDETSPPPGCTNPHGLYIEDRSRARHVTIGWKVTYECRRCRNEGTVMTPKYTEWDCGRQHAGDYIISAKRSGE